MIRVPPAVAYGLFAAAAVTATFPIWRWWLFGLIPRLMTCSGFVAPGFEISLNISSRAARPAHEHDGQASPCNTRFTAVELKILGTGHTGTICSLDDFSVHPGTPMGRRALAPGFSALVIQRLATWLS
jgi:hypothetical protein